MKTEHANNKNLGDAQAENSADRSNMPDNQVPRFRSNGNESINKIKSDANHLGTEVGEGDYGAEEAKADPEKGNKGHAGNMPNTASLEPEQ